MRFAKFFQMYYVIFYENWCWVIPKIWVNKKENTFQWPPKEIKGTIAIQKGIPVGDNWSQQTYKRILGPYGTY